MPANLNDEVAFVSNGNADGALALHSYDAWNGATLATYSSSSVDAMKSEGITPGGAIGSYFDPASNWNSTEQSLLTAGLTLWSDIANISFVLTANPAQAQTTFTRGSKGRASPGRRLDIDRGRKTSKTGVRP